MLVLADRGDFVFVQPAKGDAVRQRDHDNLQPLRPGALTRDDQSHDRSYTALMQINGSALFLRLDDCRGAQSGRTRSASSHSESPLTALGEYNPLSGGACAAAV